MIVRSLLVLAFLGLARAEEALPPLAVVPNDTIIVANGDPVPGMISEIRPDGTIIITPLGRSGTISFTRGQYDTYEQRQDARQAVLNRGRLQIKRKDALGVRQTLDWGIRNEAIDAATDLSAEAMKVFPEDTTLGAIALQLLGDAGRNVEIVPIAEKLLKASVRFEPAYSVLADHLRDAGKMEELATLTNEFLKVNPSSPKANKIKAELAGASDPRGALEAFRRSWTMHGDLDAALGYGRLALRMGMYTKVEEAAQAMMTAGQHQAEAEVMIGTARIAGGKLDEGAALLRQSLARDQAMDAEFLTWAQYNLGVAEYRLGNLDAARARWTEAQTPVAGLALAIAEHRPYTNESALPKNKAISDLVREHNACVALESRQADRALASLNVTTSNRHLFLANVAQVLKTAGSEASIHQLAAVEGVESLRWRAYGLLLARNWRDAETLLRRLPEDDGYAAVYRIYLAAAQNDPARAKDLFRKLSMTANAPTEYVAVLAAEYAAENDEVFSEDFDWVAGDVLASGWQNQAVETNIRIFVADGTLVMEGMQTPSPEPVTRAWRMVGADRIRQIELQLDISGIGSAKCGLEIADAERKTGMALGILADNKLGWRPLANGAWGDWQPLPLRIEGTHPLLKVEFTAGRVYAVPPDQPTQRYALGEVALPTTGFLAVGLFGQAEPGQSWRLAGERMLLQMKPSGPHRR